jgi:dethiobiotin synthetase
VKGIFVTGTDTNIGKTFIACTITKVLRDHEVDVGVMKPFATSTRRYSAKFGSEDAWRLSGAAKVIDSNDLINPYFYRIGTAPYLSAILGHVPAPDLSVALEKLRRLSRRHEFLVVEGIGGILVPVSKKETVLDFIKMVGFPTIIVASPKLGTINHTLLTFEACHRSRIPVKAIIINMISTKPSQVQAHIPSLISELTGVKRVIEIPRIQSSYALKKIKQIIGRELFDFRI